MRKNRDPKHPKLKALIGELRERKSLSEEDVEA